MSITINYDTTIDTMIIQFIGSIHRNDIPQLNENFQRHPDYRTNLNQLCDLTKGKLQLSIEERQQVAEEFQKLNEIFGLDRKLAFVVSRDLEYGMMKTYEEVLPAIENIQVQVFRSIDNAREWLQSA